MAGDQTQSKTEQATPKKREDARKKGQVALSQELSSTVLLMAGFAVLAWTAGDMMQQLADLIRREARFQEHREWTIEHTSILSQILLQISLRIMGGLFAGSFLAGLGGNISQVGFQIQSESMQLKWSKLSPAEGYSKLFSIRSSIRGLWGVLKLAGIGFVAILVMNSKLDIVQNASHLSLLGAINLTWDVTLDIVWAVCGMLLAIAMLDYFYQRWQQEEDLKMSRQEIKDEHKQNEGDPLVKGRLRRLQREAARNRMLQDVQDSSVVITNPTHLAIAIKYERGVMQTPIVVAKGEGLMAKRIRELAAEHGIPVLERKPLARALYAAVEVGQEIPSDLFRAVAEILAYIYRMRRGA